MVLVGARGGVGAAFAFGLRLWLWRVRGGRQGGLHALRARAVLVHVLHAAADAEEEEHEALLGEARVVDEVGVDEVLQVAAAVVGEEDVDGLAVVGAAAARAAVGGDAVVDAVDDVRAVAEEVVGLDLLHGVRDGFGAKGAADLFEGEELRGRRVLDKVDVGEAALEGGGEC